MAKIAISLPDDVYQAVEKARLAQGESRSQFFRRAVEERLRRAKERADVEQYVKGYQLYPETKEEVAMAEATLQHSFDDDSWEEVYQLWLEAQSGAMP
jgi:metal-responsive CopG/Arc/MetJ family transcriptional regulator